VGNMSFSRIFSLRLSPFSTVLKPAINQTSSSLPQLSSRLLPFISKRNATHKSEGVANRAARSAGKRLGAKAISGEMVNPGSIIFRQRGTLWHSGENTKLGRDHTITSTIRGYVRYYQDPTRGVKDRGYIGVVYKPEDILPLPLNSPRSRKLGMQLVERVEREQSFPAGEREGQGGVWRLPNWELGKIMDEVEQTGHVRNYKRGDRWLAWRKRVKRVESNRLRRTVRGK
jgi:large subunit ribosomal protein L27